MLCLVLGINEYRLQHRERLQLLRGSFIEPPVPIIRNAQFAAIFQQDIKALCGNAHLGALMVLYSAEEGIQFFLKLSCFSCKIRVVFNKSNTRRVQPKSLGFAKPILPRYPPFVPKGTWESSGGFSGATHVSSLAGLGNHPGVIGCYPCFVPSGTRESSGGDRLLPMFRPYGTRESSGGNRLLPMFRP